MIEKAYLEAVKLGLKLYCEDEAGPYRTQPYPAQQWRPVGQPGRYSHEFFPNGTAKILTLFEPETGHVRVKGVSSTKNAVLHPWLKEQLQDILATLPPAREIVDVDRNRANWEIWQEGLTERITLPEKLPALRLLLVLDNLAGHKTVDWVLWCFEHGIMLLFTPLGGSWLNMAESIQKILKGRALGGTHPTEPSQIVEQFEAVSEVWNECPTPFKWGGARQLRRKRGYERQRKLAASGAYIEGKLPPNLAGKFTGKHTN